MSRILDCLHYFSNAAPGGGKQVTVEHFYLDSQNSLSRIRPLSSNQQYDHAMVHNVIPPTNHVSSFGKHAQVSTWDGNQNRHKSSSVGTRGDYPFQCLVIMHGPALRRNKLVKVHGSRNFAQPSLVLSRIVGSKNASRKQKEKKEKCPTGQ